MPVVREELVALNRQIASHAQARDLAATRSTLATLESKGWANGHTYAAAVHALCRCGDWRSAEEALDRAEKAGLFNRGAGAASGLITRALGLSLFLEVQGVLLRFCQCQDPQKTKAQTCLEKPCASPRNVHDSRLRGVCAGSRQSP